MNSPKTVRTISLTVTALAVLLVVGFAGCTSKSNSEFEPGTGYKETGNTVHLVATVGDIINKEIYPGMRANMWGFCFAPKEQTEAKQDVFEYSSNAIEYFGEPTATFKFGDQGPGNASLPAKYEGTCSTPGPTLRVQQGDRVIVEFTNNHVHPHTIHWHGQYVPWLSDGVPGSTQNSTTPGNTIVYDFIASRAGTLWYHCHVDTQFHVMQGLYGVIIVEPQDKSLEPKDIDHDQVLVLSTLRRSLVENTPARQLDPHADHKALGGNCSDTGTEGVTGDPGCKNPPVDITADTFMINGYSFPSTLNYEHSSVKIAPDERIRLRILNAGTTFETLHPHGHDFYVTHTDGNPIPEGARVYKDTLPIGPGERLDVVIEGREGNEGVWVMHTHVVNHVTNDHMYPGGMLTKILYPGFEKQPFPGAELPGGLEYVAPISYPGDVLVGDIRTMETAQDASEDFTFEVEEVCAVRSIRVSVGVDAALPSTQQLNDLTVTITDAMEEVQATIPMEDASFVSWLFEADLTKENFPKLGEWIVTVAGQSVESELEINVAIDYINSQAEDDALGGRCIGRAPL